MTRRELFKALTFGLVGAAMPLPKAAAAPAPAMIPDEELPGAVDLRDFEGSYTLVGLDIDIVQDGKIRQVRVLTIDGDKRQEF